MPIVYPPGVIPSPKDIRDYPVVRASNAPIPRRLDLAPGAQAVRDQGPEGTCVGHALTSAMGWHQRNRNAPGQSAPDNEILSPRDSYWVAREWWPVQGQGAMPRAALKGAQREGALSEARAPYIAGQEDWRPPVDAHVARAQNRIRTFRSLRADALDEIALGISQHGPLLYTLMADDNFGAAKPGEVVRRGGPIGGLHAVVAIGYDLDLGAIKLMNSYSTSWGDAGFCWYDPSRNIEGEAYTLDPEDTPGPGFIPLHERILRIFRPDWAVNP